MPTPTHVRTFVSNTPAYHEAFHTFLSHTDQKEKALVWLKETVAGLPARERFIDAGAGTGKLTAVIGASFDSTVAMEPNPDLAVELRAACPSATVVSSTITAAPDQPSADFVLCSHVFYYIPRKDWEANVQRLTGWLKPGGVLAVALQNPRSDCMAMVHHFTGGRPDLATIRAEAEATPGGRFTARVETVPAHNTADDRETACRVCEFILNTWPMPSPPTWVELERYVETHFARTGGGYDWSCDQDILRVERVA